ncbi:hypothetical protein QJS10_CPB14g00019 [Acorus calamus]|uniref:NmrA-like domain-containing protein n=1 Tax=Acorus calamus TaxID=4465 RepID=A0AAV9DAM3_ACOCL|nr:hypothetical protein QJS10_CPB14g00019 [Acorus calamus]
MASKILIIGGTGYIGKFIVEASAKSAHPTFALVREATVNDPAKAPIIESFKAAGVTLLYGDIYDHQSLVKAFKQVDVVISTVGARKISDQVKIIDAIKEAGNIKKFYPSEFGNDVDRSHAVDPAKSVFATKAEIRRKIEKEGIPYTIVSSNFFAGYFLPTLAQLDTTTTPREKVTIFGDGNNKGTPCQYNISFNELVALWEKKIGKSLVKTYLSEEEVLKLIAESPLPFNIVHATNLPINAIVSINHSVFVKGDQTNFEINPSFGVEASQLYPDVKYTTVDEYLNQFV